MCLGAAFTFAQSSWAQTATPPRPIEIEPHTEAPAPPVKVPLKTIPLQTVRPPTAEELSHIVAYYVAATHTLHIRNAEHFDLGIRSGKFLATWTKGASKATVRGIDGSAINADVINDDLTKDTPPIPKVGDTRYVENEEIVSQAQQIEDCKDFFSAAKRLGYRGVIRHYTHLDNTGKETGTETFTVIQRVYYYNVIDCSAGFSFSDDEGSAWTLTVSAWPNP
jgi:hypothetical protein